MTWSEKNPPYQPGTWLFFTDDDGVKQGKVISITTTITEQGKDTKWNIAETRRNSDGNIETIIYHKPIGALAVDWENILENAKKEIFGFQYATEQKTAEDEYAF